MTPREALKAATARLAAITDTPRLDAELLMAHALEISRERLLLDPPAIVPVGFESLLDRRVAREPIAYIVGERDFWTLSLKVTPDVLIPRGDSETLIEAALAHFKGQAPPATILDLGTGSGALLLAALSEYPDASGLGIDQSGAALAVATGNAARCGLSSRAAFRQGNWSDGLEGLFDLILCNPPYVEATADLAPEVLREPHAALFAGLDGLDDYRRLAPEMARLISACGCAVIEIGATQSDAVTALLQAQQLAVRVAQDLGGRDRCLIVTRERPFS